MSRLKTLCTALLLGGSLFANAQSDTLVIKPGGKMIDGSVIKPYTNKWKVTYITAEGNEVPNKIWTDYGQIIELDDKKYFHRVQDLYDPQMKLQDTWINMLEHQTLIPVSFSTLNPKGGFSHYQFEGNKITGSTNLNKESETKEINAELSEAVFDWNLYGMLLVGLPLKDGLVAKMPFYGAQANAVQWLVASVEGKEKMTLPNGSKIDTWKVTTNQKLTFWISKSAPYVIKLELALQNNARLVWEVI